MIKGIDMKLTDLKDFCADENFGRPMMENYWVRNGYAYATNGHILIRINVNEPDTISKAMVPNAQKLIDDVKENCSYDIDFSQQINFVKKPVYKIKQDEVMCDDCDGDGMTECIECGADKECDTCGGSGKLSEKIYSDEIIGEEFADRPFIKILNVYFNQTYIALIQKHFTRGIIKAIGETTAMKIEFPDALVVLMPVRYADEGYIELKIEANND